MFFLLNGKDRQLRETKKPVRNFYFVNLFLSGLFVVGLTGMGREGFSLLINVSISISYVKY